MSNDMDHTEIDIPTYFLCPISLEMMKDPVTVPTGITYDRDSIERWLFSGKNTTCPVTKQVIVVSRDDNSSDLMTPNITLRRLIQSWCMLNASHGVDRIPTPKPPVSRSQIAKLVAAGPTMSAQQKMKCLKKLKSFAKENDANRRCIESTAGAVDFLASVVVEEFDDHDDKGEREDVVGVSFVVDQFSVSASDEALSLLHGLQISESGLKALVNRNHEFVDSLARVMRSGSYESRTYAVSLAKSMFAVADPLRIIGVRNEFFGEVVQVIRDQVSRQATKAALSLLIELCPWGRNRIKAVHAGLVPVLVDLLLDSNERRPCEMAMAVLDLVCQCADGRAELVKHAAGLAVVSKKMLRVSSVVTEKAARVLLSVGKSSASTGVLQEMVQIGVVAKLCLVLQVESSHKAKDKAMELLRLHAKVWKNSPCIPPSLLYSYPA
ncbi:E3 ubiquitin-protein ligase PUB22 [Linum grandiflorum]